VALRAFPAPKLLYSLRKNGGFFLQYEANNGRIQ